MKTTIKITVFALILNSVATFSQTLAVNAHTNTPPALFEKPDAPGNEAVKTEKERIKALRYPTKEKYLATINRIAEQREIPLLREMEMPENSLEVRVWTLQSFTHPTVYRLLRQNDKYEAFIGASYELTPVSGWTNLWDRLETLDFLTLPGSSFVIPYGITYVVEINDGGNYRTYHYNNPKEHKTPEAGKMVAIMDLFREEMKVAYPKAQSSATITERGKEPEPPFASLTAESLASPQEYFVLALDYEEENIVTNKWYEPKKIRLDPDSPDVSEYVRIAIDNVSNDIEVPVDVIPIAEIQGENMIVTLAWYSPESLTQEALATTIVLRPKCYFGVYIDIKKKKVFSVQLGRGHSGVEPERERRKPTPQPTATNSSSGSVP